MSCDCPVDLPCAAWVCLQFVIVVFPDRTHLMLLITYSTLISLVISEGPNELFIYTDSPQADDLLVIESTIK